MDTLRDIRSRVRTVKQTLQVTNAMKLISTSKLRKARKNLEAARPYFDHIESAMRDIILQSESLDHKWFVDTTQKSKDTKKRVATLVITADKGLAGGYNNNIIKFAEENCPPGSYLILVGNIGKRYFTEKDYKIIQDFTTKLKEPAVYLARMAATFIINSYLNGQIDAFRIIFTKMYSIVKLLPKVIDLLPLNKEDLLTKAQSVPNYQGSAGIQDRYHFHPNENALFDILVERYMQGIIYSGFIESFTSEQAARMTAMDSASKNAQEMLDTLRLRYNRARQAAITKEVSEIVAGASTLEDA